MSVLEEFTERDQERISKYVNMYLDSRRKDVPKLDDLLKTEKWDDLKVFIEYGMITEEKF